MATQRRGHYCDSRRPMDFLKSKGCDYVCQEGSVMNPKSESSQADNNNGTLAASRTARSLITPLPVAAAAVLIALAVILVNRIIGDVAENKLVNIALGGAALALLTLVAVIGVIISRTQRLNRWQLLLVGNQLTESRRVEKAVRESEARYRAVADSAVEAIVSASSDGKIIAWNEGARRVFGYSEAEALGKPLDIMMPARYQDAHRAGVARYNATHDAHVIGKTIELRGRRKDGAEFPLELSISTWQTAEGTFYSSIIRDITERKRVEEDLRDSEARYRAQADSAVDAIVSADAAGNIVYWNGGAENLFGFPKEEIIGKPLSMLMPERYRNAHRAGLARFGSTGNVHVIGQTLELHGLRRDGTEFPLELTISTWKTGEGTFYSSIIRDITQRKRAEEELNTARPQLNASVR